MFQGNPRCYEHLGCWIFLEFLGISFCIGCAKTLGLCKFFSLLFILQSTSSPLSLCHQSRKPIFHCNAKAFGLDPRIGLDPRRHYFVLGILTELVSNNAKICVTPNTNSKTCITPTPTPNASRWNIGGVGNPMRKLSRWPCRFH